MPSVGDQSPLRLLGAAPASTGRTHTRQQWVAGVAVGLLIALTTSVSLGVVVVGVEDVMLDDLRNYLRRTAETAAAQIDGDAHARFTDPAQTDTPEYLAVSAPLAVLLRTNPDIHFAYTGLVRGDVAYFVLDGDRSADRAHVMEADTPTEGELELARTHQTVVEREPSATAWGVGIRAYAPLGGQAGAEGAYAGITMSADRYYAWIQRVYRAAAIGFLVALGLAVLAGVRVGRVEGTRLLAQAEMAMALRMSAEAAEELRDLEARSQGRQKMEALGTLAGGVAHDFNNMLTVILANAELVAGDALARSASGASADAILTAGARARDVVRRILLFSRPGEEARTPVALGDVIDETVHLLVASIPSSIKVVWHRPAQPIGAIGDISQLAQMLMNLGVNATQALRADRGTIEFQLDRVELDGAEAPRLGLPPGPYARILVRDDGTGMSEHVRRRIFEPFFTTKPVGKGTGLGLSVVEGVVRRHQGALDLVSAPGSGTTFSLYLPFNEVVAPAAVVPSQAPVVTARGAGSRILLVDDEPMVLAVEARVLRRAGYEVDAHGDPNAALAALAADGRGYSVLVTDRSMPELSGLDLARRARDVSPDVPVVLLTGMSEPGDAGSPYITIVVGKPASAAVLVDAVERAMARQDEPAMVSPPAA